MSLNVNKSLINNKRLSRLQGVVLKVLATVYPDGYGKRVLPKIVGGLYGKDSLITAEELGRNQPVKEVSPVALINNARDSLRYFNFCFKGGRADWTNPKFSVSYFRSIRALLAQGLVTYQPMAHKEWGLFITERGLGKIEGRKVKVKADLWDDFILAVKVEG